MTTDDRYIEDKRDIVDAPHLVTSEGGNKTVREGTDESTFGEQSASGDMPDPESDDDVTVMAQEVGLYLDENEEDPQPLNFAAEFDKAEEEHRTGKPQ